MEISCLFKVNSEDSFTGGIIQRNLLIVTQVVPLIRHHHIIVKRKMLVVSWVGHIEELLNFRTASLMQISILDEMEDKSWEVIEIR